MLKTNDSLLIKHLNIKENHLDRCGLHLKHDGTRVLAKNLRLCAQKYWHDKDSLKETFTHLNTVNKHSKLITYDLNHESNFVHSVEKYDLALNIWQIDSETPNNNSLDDMLVLQNLHVSYPNNIIIGHLNINSIRNKFEMLSLSVQFVIFNLWKVPWNWISFFIKILLLYHLVCYITWLDTTLGNLQARSLCWILLFLWNNSLAI